MSHLAEMTARIKAETGLECLCDKCQREANLMQGETFKFPLRFPLWHACACGNKRCPKASDHRLECTGSNEPGQPGSVYA